MLLLPSLLSCIDISSKNSQRQFIDGLKEWLLTAWKKGMPWLFQSIPVFIDR